MRPPPRDRRPLILVTAFTFWHGAGLSPAAAQEPTPVPGAPAAPAPPTPPAAAAVPTHPAAGAALIYKVKKEPLSVKTSLRGILEAEEMVELALRPAAWAQLSVMRAAPPGAAVKEGDEVLVLDPQKLDEAIRDLDSSREISALALRQAEEELELLEKSSPLDLALAKEAMERSDQDLLRFLKVDRPLSEKTAEVSLRNSKNFLEYEEEELRQLEKMYKADDLTEETEEIVLRRQRDAVERLRFSVESAQVNRERVLGVDLPRQEERLKNEARRQALNWEKAQETTPLTLKQKRVDVEKRKLEQGKMEERLAKLKADRAVMTVKAPRDGVVYYGQCVGGKWPHAATMAQKLRRGGVLQEHEVFMTLVQPGAMFIRATVPESELSNLRPGLRGVAIPTGYPGRRLGVEVVSVSAAPLGAEFDGRIALAAGGDRSSLMPGMTCAIEFVPYQKPAALTVPRDSLLYEPDDPGKGYLYLKQGSSPEKRYVQTGRQVEQKVEVVEGVAEGDEVLLKPPAE